MSFDTIRQWFYSLGEDYGVNPLVFGAIPFFSLSIAWLVKNYHREKSIVLPIMSAMFFFISAYLYLLAAGKYVPFWVYALLILLVAFGGFSTVKNVRGQITGT